MDLNIALNSLVIFRNLLDDSVISKLSAFLCCDDNTANQVALYSEFVSELYKNNSNLTDYVLNLVLEDENIYIQKCATSDNIDDNLKACLDSELKILEKISKLSSAKLTKDIKYSGFLPEFYTSDIDFTKEYFSRIDKIGEFGYGIFAKHHMFIVKKSVITPVKYPDDVKLSQLVEYKKERDAVIDNTISLLNGKNAANTLLYGDAGTGKSTTVKAIVNEYKDKGLRLIEIAKKQLRDIPTILDTLSRYPLKFILFIDDLSFSSNDDDFGALKAILEGSVSARTKNVVIYATSNRRHLIKESFADREGDEVHLNDTIQELLSLSDRFGLSVHFSKPNKDEFLNIVDGLAKQNKIDAIFNESELHLKAEQFAISHSGRSARVAKQFIEKLIAELE